MEKLRQNREQSPLFRRALVIAGVGTGILALAGCSGDSQPSSNDVFDPSTIQVFEYPEVTDATGEPLKCVIDIGGGGAGYGDWAWEAMSCDFVGAATFAGEQEN